MIRWLIILLLLPSLLYARNYRAINSGTSFPVTLVANDSAVFTSNTTTTGNGLILSGDSIYVNGAGYTMTWGTNYGDNQNGLYISNGVDHVIVHKLRLEHGGGYRAVPYDTSSDCDGIDFRTCTDVLIESCYVEADGHNAKGFQVLNGSYPRGIELACDTFLVNGKGYTSRAAYDAACGRIDGGSMTYLSPYDYHFDIHDCYFYGPHTGIGSIWNIKLRIHKNTFACDAVNEYYSTYDGNSYHTSVNPYAVTCFRLAGGSIIDSNTITAGQLREGCEGFLLECADASAESPVLVFGNVMNINNGPNFYIEDGQCGGIMNRGRGHRYVYIYDNDITITVDDDTSTHAIGIEGIGLRLEHGNENYECGSGWSSYNKAYNNRVSFVSDGNTSTYPLSFCNGDSSTGNECYGNYFEGVNSLFSFGATFGAANMNCMNALAYACTLNAIDGVPDEVFRVGRWTGSPDSSYGNIARDFVYQGDITDWHDVTFIAGSGEHSIEWQRTLDIYVYGQDSLALDSAIVIAIDAYGHTQDTAYTDETGHAQPIVTHRKELYIAADSTGHNPFMIKAVQGAYRDSISLTVSPTAYTDTIYIAGAGTGERPDSLVGLFVHASVGRGVLKDLWPYATPLLWRADSLVAAREWPLNNELYNFNWNGTHGASPYGLRSSAYATGNENNQMGWELSYDFPLSGYDGGWMSQENWDEKIDFWRDFFNTTYNPRTGNYAWSAMMLPDSIWDYTANPDSFVAYIDYDYIIMKTSYFWQDATYELINTYKSRIQAACDSAANYPDKVFGFWFGSPVKLGGPTNPSSADRAANMQLDKWFRDTLVTPANVVTWGYYHILVESSPDSTRYGCIKSIYESGDDHPNDAAYAVLQDSTVKWFDWFFDYLYDYYDTATTPEPTPPSNLMTAAIDSFHNDYSVQLDSARFRFTTANESWPDSVILCWGYSGYVDSSDGGQYFRKAIAYPGAVQTDTAFIIFSLTEPDTLYLSIWVMDADSGWSSRATLYRYYYYQAPSQPNQLVYASIDSFFHDHNGENDSDLVVFTTSGQTGCDSVIFAWSVLTYPDSSGALRKAIGYTASLTDTINISFGLTEPGYVYLSTWVHHPVGGYSVRKTAYRYFQYTAPGTPGRFVRVFKGG